MSEVSQSVSQSLSVIRREEKGLSDGISITFTFTF